MSVITVIHIPANIMVGVSQLEIDNGWRGIAQAVNGDHIEHLAYYPGGWLHTQRDRFPTADAWGDDEARLSNDRWVAGNVRASLILGHEIAGDVILTGFTPDGETISAPDGLFEALFDPTTLWTPVPALS